MKLVGLVSVTELQVLLLKLRVLRKMKVQLVAKQTYLLIVLKAIALLLRLVKQQLNAQEQAIVILLT
jgi:hypothetical protein